MWFLVCVGCCSHLEHTFFNVQSIIQTDEVNLWIMFHFTALKPDVPNADKKPHLVRTEDRGTGGLFPITVVKEIMSLFISIKYRLLPKYFTAPFWLPYILYDLTVNSCLTSFGKSIWVKCAFIIIFDSILQFRSIKGANIDFKLVLKVIHYNKEVEQRYSRSFCGVFYCVCR